jgi:hypothetical protein
MHYNAAVWLVVFLNKKGDCYGYYSDRGMNVFFITHTVKEYPYQYECPDVDVH